MVVSFLTILVLLIRIAVYFPNTPPPVINLATSGVLFASWCLSFIILVKAMKRTLAQNCDIQKWDNSDGMAICRIYKVLFAFLLTGV